MLKNYVSLLKEEFKGYGPKSLLSDVMAGLTVCAVALPLALAFGVSCGADAAAGLITAILSGLVISALSGASFQISGPTGAMTAVLITIIAKDGGNLSGVFLVGLMAGVLMLLAGLLKLGKLVHLIPKPVITGFTSGIAVIIALGQVDNFFGVHSEGESAVQKLLSYGELGFKPDWHAVAIGLLVMLIMIFWPKKWNARVPSSLVGIIVAAIAAALLHLDIAEVGAIPKTIFLENRLNFTEINWSALPSYISPALTVAMLGMIESLLCGASASAMTKGRFEADVELVGQGIGNMIIPFFGGVPATAAIARTSVAIKSGCKTRLTGVFHAAFLLISMFLLGGVMSRLPMAALAGVLMMTAWRMNEWHEIRHIFKRGFKSEIAQYLITLIATVVFDLTIAIVIGIAFSLLAFISRVLEVRLDHSMVDESRLPNVDMEKYANTCVVYITGAVFFANTQKIVDYMNKLPKADRIVFSMRGVPVMDPDAAQAIMKLAETYDVQGVEVLMCGLNDTVRKVLDRAGVVDQIGEEHFYWSVDRALFDKK
ncbi:MAG: SulP family inorganic anion transporter [Clostridia bacterium]|nr:SulP family inorganic anion transporter [Clostridia bacterium]